MLAAVTLTTTLQIGVVLLGVASAVAFYVGSIGVPHDMETFDGVSPFEIGRRLRQKLFNWSGIMLLLGAALLQIWLVLQN